MNEAGAPVPLLAAPQLWYAKAWAAFAVFMGVPIYYHYYHVDEFRHPMVRVRRVARGAGSRNGAGRGRSGTAEQCSQQAGPMGAAAQWGAACRSIWGHRDGRWASGSLGSCRSPTGLAVSRLAASGSRPPCSIVALCTLRLQVPPQYPPEVREVLLRAHNSSLHYDYSAPDYEQLKERRKKFWTTFS